MQVKRFISKNGSSNNRLKSIEVWGSTESEYCSFRQIQLLLEQHAFILRQGKKIAFSEANLKLPEKVLEDIKGR